MHYYGSPEARHCCSPPPWPHCQAQQHQWSPVMGPPRFGNDCHHHRGHPDHGHHHHGPPCHHHGPQGHDFGLRPRGHRFGSGDHHRGPCDHHDGPSHRRRCGSEQHNRGDSHSAPPMV